ncbi:YeiH family putative sulfate export transporter [Peribacillus muralis]|uniref:YeiH family protein n=1 Tax=Peribacillus muralis TaxID=264697 RepID=UPI001F4E3DC7|nr:YeiH family protein [Peribacillus muralis]MCK1993388.1 YeiH family protein [Peribacillus muralis]MCK2014324.1 YeiH family protein [Peribacillus muralis]
MERTEVKIKKLGFTLGVSLTLLIAIAAKYLAELPFLHIIGQLVLAILIGVAWKYIFGVPAYAASGTNYSSKVLLRVGIILLGMRLNLKDIFIAGPRTFAVGAISLVFAILVVYGLTRLFKVDKKLGILTACGTGICGAAAILAISTQIKAKEKETAVAVATVAVLGTTFTFGYTILYPLLGLSHPGYGIFAGATLHEIAHVIAAAAPGGNEAVDLAVMVKLTRVALLIPVALLIGFLMNWKERSAGVNKSSWKSLQIPWFIFGFLFMSTLNSSGIVPESVTEILVTLSYILMAMSMAGLGLNIDLWTFKKYGAKPFAAGLIGSILLSLLGYVLVHVFHLN